MFEAVKEAAAKFSWVFALLALSGCGSADNRALSALLNEKLQDPPGLKVAEIVVYRDGDLKKACIRAQWNNQWGERMPEAQFNAWLDFPKKTWHIGGPGKIDAVRNCEFYAQDNWQVKNAQIETQLRAKYENESQADQYNADLAFSHLHCPNFRLVEGKWRGSVKNVAEINWASRRAAFRAQCEAEAVQRNARAESALQSKKDEEALFIQREHSCRVADEAANEAYLKNPNPETGRVVSAKATQMYECLKAIQKDREAGLESETK